MKNKIFTVLKLLLFLGIGVFFIWLFLKNLTPAQKEEIFDSFIHADFTWFYGSMIIGIASHTFRSLRWKMLLKPMGYNPKTSNVILAVFIGYLANLALPRLGEVSKCGALTRYEKIPLNKSFGTVVTERAIDALTLIVLFVFTIALNFNRLNEYVNEKIYAPAQDKMAAMANPSIVFYIIIAILLLLIITFFVIRKRIQHLKIYKKVKEIIGGFLEGISSLKNMKRPWLFILYTILIWVCYLMMTHVVFNAIDETVGLGINASLIVLIFGSIGIIVVQGGIGIYPAIVAETLVLYNVDSSVGYALGWLLWSAQTLMIIVLGSVSFGLLAVFNKPKKE